MKAEYACFEILRARKHENTHIYAGLDKKTKIQIKAKSMIEGDTSVDEIESLPVSFTCEPVRSVPNASICHHELQVEGGQPKNRRAAICTRSSRGNDRRGIQV